MFLLFALLDYLHNFLTTLCKAGPGNIRIDVSDKINVNVFFIDINELQVLGQVAEFCEIF